MMRTMTRATATLSGLAFTLLVSAASAWAQNPDPVVTGLMAKVSEREILDTSRALQGMTSRSVGSPGNAGAAAYLHSRFAAIPNLTVEYQDAKWRNVVATLKGSDADSTAVIIMGAHYDSAAKNPAAAPGATDDAAGVALVLEMARILSTQRFKHTLKFALWNGEETGLKGSSSYVAEAAARKDDIRLYMNFDSVCHDPKGQMILDIVFNKAAEPVKNSMVANNTIYDLGFTFQFNRHNCGGDHAPFSKSGFKIIAAHQQDHAFQHTPGDTVDKITPRYAIQIARLYLTVLVPMAEPVQPAAKAQSIERTSSGPSVVGRRFQGRKTHRRGCETHRSHRRMQNEGGSLPPKIAGSFSVRATAPACTATGSRRLA
jgi:hypothetical protein